MQTNSHNISVNQVLLNFTSKYFSIAIVLSLDSVYYTLEWNIVSILVFAFFSLNNYKFDTPAFNKFGQLYLFIKDLTSALLTLLIIHLFYLALLLLPLIKMYIFK